MNKVTINGEALTAYEVDLLVSSLIITRDMAKQANLMPAAEKVKMVSFSRDLLHRLIDKGSPT